MVEGYSAQTIVEVLQSSQSFGTHWDSSIPVKTHDSWCIHPVFHVSLLKQWRTSLVQLVPGDEELEHAYRPKYFDVEKILWWRWSSKT